MFASFVKECCMHSSQTTQIRSAFTGLNDGQQSNAQITKLMLDLFSIILPAKYMVPKMRKHVEVGFSGRHAHHSRTLFTSTLLHWNADMGEESRGCLGYMMLQIGGDAN